MVDFAKLRPLDWTPGILSQVGHAHTHLRNAKVGLTFEPVNFQELIQNLDNVALALNSIERFASLEHEARARLKAGASIIVPESAIVEPEPEYDILTRGQKRALERITRWVQRRGSGYFVLRGYPGTGKTFLMRYLKRAMKNVNWIFTAPTNKATGVLSEAIGEQCRTTFSALGLRMQQKEDELVMEYGKTAPYFPKNTVLVVDEASMVNDALMKFIEKVRADHDILVLYVGDPYQLPPVGQKISRVWTMVPREFRASLREIRRFDNQLLVLTKSIRECIRQKHWVSPIVDDHDDKQGIIKYHSRRHFVDSILTNKSPEDFDTKKVMAWRNKTVDRYNGLIRENLKLTGRFAVNDRLLLAAPIIEDEQVVGHIDDELIVRSITTGTVKADIEKIDVHRIEVEMNKDRRLLNIAVDEVEVKKLLSGLGDAARRAKGAERRALWDRFWAADAKFQHTRYGYSMTLHRVQGTTLHTGYLDQQDLLANPNKSEAFRGLMVGASRPSTFLETY